MREGKRCKERTRKRKFGRKQIEYWREKKWKK
jgi:hypothetical protein